MLYKLLLLFDKFLSSDVYCHYMLLTSDARYCLHVVPIRLQCCLISQILMCKYYIDCCFLVTWDKLLSSDIYCHFMLLTSDAYYCLHLVPIRCAMYAHVINIQCSTLLISYDYICLVLLIMDTPCLMETTEYSMLFSSFLFQFCVMMSKNEKCCLKMLSTLDAHCCLMMQQANASCCLILQH